MSVQLEKLVEYTNQLLDIQNVQDYCPNGLQVEGKAEVNSVLGGVTASQALVDEAVTRGVDVVLVHHGYFWKGEDACITGIKRRRLKTLLENNISLLAYHLPLDIHSELGNNIQLAGKLGFEVTGPLEKYSAKSVGLIGKLTEPISAGDLKKLIDEALDRECLHIGDADRVIQSIGWCTGAAQGMIDLAVAQGLDAYLSGEISEPTVHIARETGIDYFSAGHHATERYGVQALGKNIAHKFDIDFNFLDIDNPV